MSTLSLFLLVNNQGEIGKTVWGSIAIDERGMATRVAPSRAARENPPPPPPPYSHRIIGFALLPSPSPDAPTSKLRDGKGHAHQVLGSRGATTTTTPADVAEGAYNGDLYDES